MIRLEEFGIPRPGWTGRRRAIARMTLGALAMIVIAWLAIVYVLTGGLQ